MAFWSRRKPIDEAVHAEAGRSLRKTLSWPHLMALGVGAIVGTGIYTLIGVGAGLASPGYNTPGSTSSSNPNSTNPDMGPTGPGD